MPYTQEQRRKPTRTKLQQAWHDMRRRCYDPKSSRYSRYGARGITICDEWRDNFEAFKAWSLANGFADDLTIDRKDNDNGYTPENCRWIARRPQVYSRSSNRTVTHNGETLSLAEWADRLGLDAGLLWSRIFREEWSVERALTTPPMTRQQAGAASAAARRAA